MKMIRKHNQGNQTARFNTILYGTPYRVEEMPLDGYIISSKYSSGNHLNNTYVLFNNLVSNDETGMIFLTNEFAKVFKEDAALKTALAQLNAAIARVSAINLTGKTAASAQAVTDAFAAAEAVRDSANSVQDMKDAITAMDVAVAALVDEPVIP